MALSKRQQTALQNIIKQAELILRDAGASDAPRASRKAAKPSKVKGAARSSGRRSRTDAAAMRKEIAAARKKGVRVAELAEKYGVTTSYIYQLR